MKKGDTVLWVENYMMQNQTRGEKGGDGMYAPKLRLQDIRSFFTKIGSRDKKETRHLKTAARRGNKTVGEWSADL